MEVVINVAAVLGVILSAASVITLVSQRARNALSRMIRKYGKADETEETITEIKTMLEQHIEDEDRFKKEMEYVNETTLEFTKTQCRNIIKDKFYQYNDTKVLPLYEKKTLMNIEELYIGRLNCNSYARLLLEEMKTWEVDYENCHPYEDEY